MKIIATILFSLAFLTTKAQVKYETPTPPDVRDEVDRTQLTRDLMQVKHDANYHALVFWIPAEYWGIALRLSKSLPESSVVEMENLTKDYTVFWIGNFHTSSGSGRLIMDDSETLVKNFHYLNRDGRERTMLNPSELDSKFKIVLEAMRPMLKKMLGQFGEGIQLVVYNNKSKLGKQLISPVESGGFKVILDDKTFTYTTPLPSLMPPQHCPEDGAKMNGDWIYCPYHGVKLPVHQ